MNKMVKVLVIVCVLNVLAGVAIAGFLFGTGRLDGSKVRVIADLARHRGTPDKLREKVGEILEPTAAGAATASAPASQKGRAPGEIADDHSPASAQARIDFARQAMEQERIRLENQAQELRHRQDLLEQLQTSVESDRKNFEAAKKAFEPKVTGADDRAKAENFQKMLALYDELKTKQVKDLFIDSNNPELIASYLAAMDPSRAAKIIGEFKTPEERKFINPVLERIRTAGTASASGPPAGGDVAAAAPRP
jgi:hypothetical protein